MCLGLGWAGLMGVSQQAGALTEVVRRSFQMADSHRLAFSDDTAIRVFIGVGFLRVSQGDGVQRT